MSAGSVLVKIENFKGAYNDRLKDLKNLYSKTNRKVICMYLGGVVVECYLKKLLIEKYNIKRRKGLKFWYDENTVESLIEKHNIQKSEYNEKITIENPGHSYRDALDLLGISDIIPQNVSKHFDKIYNPLDGDKCNFIDLRYSTEEEIKNIDFEDWYTSFKNVNRWLNSHKKFIED